MTIRLAPVEATAEALQRGLGELAASVPQRPGLVGLHVLRHEAPALAATTEQKIRGNADRAADWVVVACGYDLAALRRLEAEELGEAQLHAMGAAPGTERRFYGLAYSATASDIHDSLFHQETT